MCHGVLLVDSMCGLSHDDVWVLVDQHGCCDSWNRQRRNSRDAEHEVVEAQNRVGGRLGAADGQVDTRVLARTDKWYGIEKAWPIWSFVTRGYARANDRDFLLYITNQKISTDVVSNVQLGSVELYVILNMLCTGRALDCVVCAKYSWRKENLLRREFPVERCETSCTDA